MKNIFSFYRIILPCAFLFFFAGCNLLGSDDPEPGTASVAIINMINSQAITLNSQAYVSPAGHNYSVTLIEYILTNISLVNENGESIVLAASHYINGDDAATLATPAVEIPAGTYVALKFTFGVKGDENVFGNLERTSDYDNMMWPMMMPMGDGQTERYHYMRFEGRYGTEGVFRIHTGPSSGNDYSIEVELPMGFDVDGEDWSLGIDVNLDQWITNPNPWNFDDYGMIMGNPAAQSLIYDNGRSVFGLNHTRIK